MVISIDRIWSCQSNKFHLFCSLSYKFSPSPLASLRSTWALRNLFVISQTHGNHWRLPNFWMTSKSTKSPFLISGLHHRESKNYLARHSLDFYYLRFWRSWVMQDPNVPYEAPVIMTGLFNNGKTQSQEKAPHQDCFNRVVVFWVPQSPPSAFHFGNNL